MPNQLLDALRKWEPVVRHRNPLIRWARHECEPAPSVPEAIVLRPLAERGYEVWKGVLHQAPRKLSPGSPEQMAQCKLLRYDGSEAECEVRLGGYELPLVSLPAQVLKAHGLKGGARFIWTLRGSTVSREDIDPDVSKSFEPRLSDEELAEIERLHAESVAHENDTDLWKEYTGPAK